MSRTDVFGDANTVSERWDAGCTQDEIRNDFVIPTLTALLKRYSPKDILDVGSATGYVPLAVNEAIGMDVSWHLIDKNKSHVNFAVRAIPPDSDILVENTSFSDFAKSRKSFDCILFSFSLLEMAIDEDLFECLDKVSRNNSFTIVVMPDVIWDVHETQNVEKMSRYCSGLARWEKKDKFTGQNYPFFAHRFETLIQKFLEAGFFLTDWVSQNRSHSGVFIMVFKKKNEVD